MMCYYMRCPTKTLESLNAYKSYIYLDGKIAQESSLLRGLWEKYDQTSFRIWDDIQATIDTQLAEDVG